MIHFTPEANLNLVGFKKDCVGSGDHYILCSIIEPNTDDDIFTGTQVLPIPNDFDLSAQLNSWTKKWLSRDLAPQEWGYDHYTMQFYSPGVAFRRTSSRLNHSSPSEGCMTVRQAHPDINRRPGIHVLESCTRVSDGTGKDDSNAPA
jgi:hypothetical protein